MTGFEPATTRPPDVYSTKLIQPDSQLFTPSIAVTVDVLVDVFIDVLVDLTRPPRQVNNY